VVRRLFAGTGWELEVLRQCLKLRRVGVHARMRFRGACCWVVFFKQKTAYELVM